MSWQDYSCSIGLFFFLIIIKGWFLPSDIFYDTAVAWFQGCQIKDVGLYLKIKHPFISTNGEGIIVSIIYRINCLLTTQDDEG